MYRKMLNNTFNGTRKISERRRNSLTEADAGTCIVCKVDLSKNPFEIAYIDCNNCGKKVCRNQNCAIWISKRQVWECNRCNCFNSTIYAQTYDWILERFNKKFVQSDSFTDGLPTENQKQLKNGDVMLELNGKASPIPLQQRIRVREFIEDLISSMLGGSLDDVYVGQLSKNLEYLRLFTLFHTELSNVVYKLEISLHNSLSDLPLTETEDSPGTSYDNLRKLVHSIVQEVLSLPETYNQIGNGSNFNPNQISKPFDPKKYEDLLATAVLNKIVESYSNDKKYENSSGIVSAGSDFDSNYTNGKASSRFDQNSRRSSIEPHSESSTHEFKGDSSMSMKAADIIDEIFREKLDSAHLLSPTSRSVSSDDEAHLNSYLQNHKVSLPHLDPDADNSDEIEEEFQSVYTANSTIDPDLSANWVFKKRYSRGSNDGASTATTISATSPVGMLVPSPAIEVKTLIGDKNADEISDLSEAGSDLDEPSDIEDNHKSIDLPHVLVENKTIIGGKNEMSSLEQSKASLIDLLQPGSLVSEQSLTDQSPVISEAKNSLLFMNDPTVTSELKAAKMSDGTEKSLNENKLLIDWDSKDMEKENDWKCNGGGLIEANDVDILSKSNKNKYDYEPVPAPRKTTYAQETNGISMKFAGSIAEREHMKWKNAIDFPNNPYSPEALQRRLSKTSPTRTVDVESLAAKFEANNKNAEVSSKPTANVGKPLKVVLGEGKPDRIRYGRDYYINDAKTSSGSRKQKSCADLNYIKTCDDTNDFSDNVDNYNDQINDGDDDSLLVRDIKVITCSKPQPFKRNNNIDDLLCRTKALRVDENDPILKQAIKVDRLCTDERDYYLLNKSGNSDIDSKFDLTGDNYHTSLQQSDSLSTTFSEDSDSIRVYDLNKRETKILRHNIIRRSKNPIGETAPESAKRNSDSDYRISSPLEATIQQFNFKIVEHARETGKPPILHNKSKNTAKNILHHKKSKMTDVEILNAEPSVAATAFAEKSDNLDSVAKICEATEAFIINEASYNEIGDVVQSETKEETRIADDSTSDPADNETEEVRDDEVAVATDIIENGDSLVEFSDNPTLEAVESLENSSDGREVKTNEVVAYVVAATPETTNDEQTEPVEQEIQKESLFTEERQQQEVIITNGNTEKSVIEEEVLPALPSVKALAKNFSFSQNKDVDSAVPLQRPKVVWRKSFENNEGDLGNGDDLDGISKPSTDSYTPHFNHIYHPVAPGHSITARSLSTKFREELRNSANSNGMGRTSPERPPSPVLVPGILKNNIAFFENLKNK